MSRGVNRLGIGIVGAGFMGSIHALRYRAMENVKYIGVCSRDLNKARRLAEKVGARKVCTDYNELLKNPEIDVIDICLPTPLHEEVTLRAAEAGKHVLCEKPIALTLDQADRMIHATRRAGVKFMVAHVLRFWPEYTVTKRIIEDGDLGKPLLARLARLIMLPKWWKKPETMGGATIDLQIHDLDFSNWIFGKAELVLAQGVKLNESRDHILTTISYAGGGKSFVEASFAVPDGFPFTMELRLLCEGGVIEIGIRPDTPVGRTLTVYKPTTSPGYWGPEHPELPKIDGYTAEIRYFVDCVKEDKKPEISPPEDARLALELALASRESMETKRIIRLPP